MAVHDPFRPRLQMRSLRRELLLTVTVVAAMTGHAAPAGAQSCVGSGTYICSGFGTLPILIVEDNAQVIVDDELDIEAEGTGLSAVSINGSGRLGFESTEGSDVNLTSDASALEVISIGDLSTGQICRDWTRLLSWKKTSFRRRASSRSSFSDHGEAEKCRLDDTLAPPPSVFASVIEGKNRLALRLPSSSDLKPERG